LHHLLLAGLTGAPEIVETAVQRGDIDGH
jgi:hypothetical protein